MRCKSWSESIVGVAIARPRGDIPRRRPGVFDHPDPSDDIGQSGCRNDLASPCPAERNARVTGVHQRILRRFSQIQTAFHDVARPAQRFRDRRGAARAAQRLVDRRYRALLTRRARGRQPECVMFEYVAVLPPPRLALRRRPLSHGYDPEQTLSRTIARMSTSHVGVADWISPGFLSRARAGLNPGSLRPRCQQQKSAARRAANNVAWREPGRANVANPAYRAFLFRCHRRFDRRDWYHNQRFATGEGLMRRAMDEAIWYPLFAEGFV